MSKAQKILTIVLITLGASVIVVLACISIEAIKIDAQRAYTVVENKNDIVAPTNQPTIKPTPTQTNEPQTAEPVAPDPIVTPEITPSDADVIALIEEYAEYKWEEKSHMVDWEYDRQLEAYEYYKSLPDSDIKSYALEKWQERKYTNWSMVQWEYDQQIDAYNYCSTLPDSDIKSYAIDKWTDGKYIVWSMVAWEYEQQSDAYEYMQSVDWSGKDSAIRKWTDGEYVVWSMVQWEYEND
jgi:hypothetical protein